MSDPDRSSPGRPALVITSVSMPGRAMRAIAEGAAAAGYHLIVVGDASSPSDFHLENCEYHDLERQEASGFRFATACPTRHYARKNVGYLLAIRAGAPLVLETDDDNTPLPAFWESRQMEQHAALVETNDWVNVYRYFSEARIWPRGFPLDAIHAPAPILSATRTVKCPIQQGLADVDPDVDAIYRLTQSLPQSFRRDLAVALGRGSWCPFNSQNTAWWPAAYPLLYLPVHCSFRMTDIWRSFVAQRIAWTNHWSVLFHSPDVTQERNPHDLLRDFADEIPGYLHNRAICAALENLELREGVDQISENMRTCYAALVRGGWLKEEELSLLDAWLDDLRDPPTFHRNEVRVLKAESSLDAKSARQ